MLLLTGSVCMSKSSCTVDLFARNPVLYISIIVSQRYTKECEVYGRLNGSLRVSGKVKITVQDLTTHIFMIST